MILSDREIIEYISRGWLVTSGSDVFENNLVGSNSLDLRIGNKIIRLRNPREVLDPDKMDDLHKYYTVEEGEEFIVEPREHLLLTSLEYLRLPANIMGFVNLKSTYARLGLSIPPTIVNAGSEGELTIELVGGPFPIKIRRGSRIVQIVFVKLASPAENPYRGRYHNQRGPTLPKAKNKP
ncbi:MAG: dCTP deaminase [Aigarchaeota archaeon]|nr:dCTP deaminase [Aigarchaeota archaeon]MDW7986580.1 dCTP deaminase [Nitrososphaerota archaeon]